MSLRIGIGGLWHETNTFVPGLTTLDDFRAYVLAGDETDVRETFSGTATEVGGALAACEATGADPVLLAYAGAVPGPRVAADAREKLAALLLARLEAALPLDGLVLALHGGMVAEDADDPESDLLVRARELVGSTPIAVVLDLHGNPGDALLEQADIVVGYDTYPHVDAADRAAEAVGLLVETIDGTLAPLVTGRRLPLLTCPIAQATAAEPMAELLATARRLEARPGVSRVSLLPGFPYADVERLGFSVVVTGENEAANAAADEMAAAVWAARSGFALALPETEEVIAAAVAADGPTVLADVADNVGGGAPGDSTAALAALVAAGGRGVVAVLHDPGAARRAAAAGVGAGVELAVGRPPLVLRGTVRFAHEVAYRRTGSYMTGSEVDMGLTAVVEADGAEVVLTSQRVMPFDLDHLRRVGIEPSSRRVLLVKSAVAWQAAFAAVASTALAVDTGGPTTCRLETLPYRSVRCPIVPLDEPG